MSNRKIISPHFWLLVALTTFAVAPTFLSSEMNSPDSSASESTNSTDSRVTQEDIKSHSDVVLGLVYSVRIASIVGEYRIGLFRAIGYEIRDAIREDGFNEYEVIATQNRSHMIGVLPDEVINDALNSVTLEPTFNRDRDSAVYSTSRVLIYEYLEEAARGEPGAMQAAFRAFSHFSDFVLIAPYYDLPLLYAPWMLDLLFQAILAEEMGFSTQLSDAQKNDIKRLHQEFREEIRMARLEFDVEGPILEDNLIETFRRDGVLK